MNTKNHDKRGNDTGMNRASASNGPTLSPSEGTEGPFLVDDAFASSLEQAFQKSLPQEEDEALKARVWARLQKSIFKELH